MSQVKFRAEYQGKPVEVMAGWDRPLRHYFLTVFDLSPDAMDETVWSTMDHGEGGVETVGELAKALLALGIDEPEGFWDHVKLQEGNVTACYIQGRWERREF